jgi:hypothetical protein
MKFTKTLQDHVNGGGGRGTNTFEMSCIKRDDDELFCLKTTTAISMERKKVFLGRDGCYDRDGSTAAGEAMDLDLDNLFAEAAESSRKTDTDRRAAKRLKMTTFDGIKPKWAKSLDLQKPYKSMVHLTEDLTKVHLIVFDPFVVFYMPLSTDGMVVVTVACAVDEED